MPYKEGFAMIRLPQTPLSFTSHLLRCAACQEQFSVAEAFMGDNYSHPRLQRNRKEGAQISSQWSNINLNGWREPLVNGPAGHVPPQKPDTQHLHPKTAKTLHLFDRTINCPRCRADNRNWLQLQNEPARFDNGFWRYIARFPVSTTITLLVILVAIIFLYRNLALNNVQIISLSVIIILTGLLTTTAMTDSWWAQREYMYKRPFQPTNSLWEQIPPILRAGLPILPITLLVIPTLLFIMLPLSFELLSWITSSPANASFPGIGLNRHFLRAWLIFVSGVWTIVYLVTFLETSGFTKKADAILPPPVFTSVARMTPVAIREAELALQADRIIAYQIQWTQVERLPTGGIKLIGLHREETAVNAKEPPKTVRAQRYTIETDLWCRIAKTGIQDANVPPAIQLPQEWQDIAELNRLFSPAQV